MSGLCHFTIIKAKDNGIKQTAMIFFFPFLSKECVSRSFQVLWTLQARGSIETEQEANAC